MVYQGFDVDTYWVEYTGTPPDKQQFVLHSANPYGMIIKILYSDSDESYAIYDEDKNLIEPTKWDDNTRNWA